MRHMRRTRCTCSGQQLSSRRRPSVPWAMPLELRMKSPHRSGRRCRWYQARLCRPPSLNPGGQTSGADDCGPDLPAVRAHALDARVLDRGTSRCPPARPLLPMHTHAIDASPNLPHCSHWRSALLGSICRFETRQALSDVLQYALVVVRLLFQYDRLVRCL